MGGPHSSYAALPLPDPLHKQRLKNRKSNLLETSGSGKNTTPLTLYTNNTSYELVYRRRKIYAYNNIVWWYALRTGPEDFSP